MRKTFFAPIIAVALLFLSSCGQPEVESQVAKPVVSVLDLQQTLPQFTATEIGVIKASQEAELISRAGGTITKLNKGIGTMVNSDEIVASIEQNNAANPASINLNSAQIQLNNAQENLSMTTQNNLESVKVAQNNLEVAQNNLEKLLRNREELKAMNISDETTLGANVESAQKSFANAQLSYQNITSGFTQAWSDYLQNAENTFSKLFADAIQNLNLLEQAVDFDNQDFDITGSFGSLFGSRANGLKKVQTYALYATLNKAYPTEEAFYSEQLPLKKDNVKVILQDLKSYFSQFKILSSNTIDLLELTPESTMYLSAEKLAGIRQQVTSIHAGILADLNVLNQLEQNYQSLNLNDLTQSASAQNNLSIAEIQANNVAEALSKFKVTSQSALADLNTRILQAEQDLDNAKTNLVVSIRNADIQNNTQKTQVKTIGNQTQLAKAIFDYNNIRSPLVGFVSQLNVEEGDYIAPGQSIGKVIQYRQVKIVFYVSENIVRHLTINQPIYFTQPEWSDSPLSAVIAKIAPAADPTNKKFKIVAIAANPNLQLKPEMFVEVSFDLSASVFGQGKIYLPINAVLVEEDKNTVFIFQDGVAHQKTVTLGKTFGDWVTITSGLTSADQVITEGNRNLEEGREVEMK